jgi:hypothetical protein
MVNWIQRRRVTGGEPTQQFLVFLTLLLKGKEKEERRERERKKKKEKKKEKHVWSISI